MERCSADRRPCEEHRLEHGGRSKHAGAPDIHFHTNEPCCLFLRRIFERRRPLGELRRAAEAFALCKVVHLDDRAVNVILKPRTYLAYAAQLAEDVGDIIKARIKRDGFEPLLTQKIERLLVRGKKSALYLLDVENKYIEPPAGGYLRILLTERARSGVAWIFERFFALQLLLCHKLRKGLFRHIHFASDLQKRQRRFYFQRY